MAVASEMCGDQNDPLRRHPDGGVGNGKRARTSELMPACLRRPAGVVGPQARTSNRYGRSLNDQFGTPFSGNDSHGQATADDATDPIARVIIRRRRHVATWQDKQDDCLPTNCFRDAGQ